MTVTDEDRAKATAITGCVLDDKVPGSPFCAAHDEDGNPPWHRCRWALVAAALAAEREKARAPFRALVAFYDRHEYGSLNVELLRELLADS